MSNREHTVLDRTWVEVDLDRLAYNVRKVCARLRPGVEAMGVIKADAYGHGAVPVARVMLENGFTRLAVSMLDEALELRRAGITAPILLLSYTDPRRAEEIIRARVAQAAYSWDLLYALSEAGQRLGEPAYVHIKLDTGMGRIGFQSGSDSLREIAEMNRLPAVRLEGIFTHFATADEEDRAYLDWQFGQFRSLCQELERAGIHIPLKHCCNSAATLLYPAFHMDMVRPGGICYGFVPAPARGMDFQPVMRLCSSVIEVKWLEPGRSVGYNRQFVTTRRTRVATVPIGYADGYSRALSGRAKALIHGQAVPQIGRICMDACMFDVTDVPDEVLCGDEVVLLGRQSHGDRTGEIRAEELASWMGTIDYEVTTTLGKRVPRAFFRDGELVEVHKTLI